MFYRPYCDQIGIKLWVFSSVIMNGLFEKQMGYSCLDMVSLWSFLKIWASFEEKHKRVGLVTLMHWQLVLSDMNARSCSMAIAPECFQGKLEGTNKMLICSPPEGHFSSSQGWWVSKGAIILEGWFCRLIAQIWGRLWEIGGWLPFCWAALLLSLTPLLIHLRLQQRCGVPSTRNVCIHVCEMKPGEMGKDTID